MISERAAEEHRATPAARSFEEPTVRIGDRVVYAEDAELGLLEALVSTAPRGAGEVLAAATATAISP